MSYTHSIVKFGPLFLKIKIMATINLTAEQFKSDVFDYTTEKEWKYKDDVPAIIDFYADWCGPCKMVAPILEELSEEYAGKVKIYKVDTEVEQELSAVFGIRSIDRKSTRLNSSHVRISYAVFCLK